MPGLVVNHPERGCVCTYSAAFLSSSRWEKERKSEEEEKREEDRRRHDRIRSVCVRLRLKDLRVRI